MLGPSFHLQRWLGLFSEHLTPAQPKIRVRQNIQGSWHLPEENGKGTEVQGEEEGSPEPLPTEVPVSILNSGQGEEQAR